MRLNKRDYSQFRSGQIIALGSRSERRYLHKVARKTRTSFPSKLVTKGSPGRRQGR